MAPHVSRRRVGETWAAKGRKVPRGEGRTHVCYPHEWYQSVPHAHGVLRTARWACPHDLRAVRAAHPSARGPRKGRARTIVTCYYGSACFGGRSSLKSITPATSTINPIYTLGKLVSLPLKYDAVRGSEIVVHHIVIILQLAPQIHHLGRGGQARRHTASA